GLTAQNWTVCRAAAKISANWRSISLTPFSDLCGRGTRPKSWRGSAGDDLRNVVRHLVQRLAHLLADGPNVLVDGRDGNCFVARQQGFHDLAVTVGYVLRIAQVWELRLSY